MEQTAAGPVPYKQKPVSATVWPWMEPRQADGSAEDRGYGKVLLQVAIMVAIALFLRFVVHHRAVSTVVFTLAGVVSISGFFLPPVYRRIDQFGQWLGRVVGIGLSWVLLVPVFYLCFATGHLVLWLRGRDPMARGFSPAMQTYWQKCRGCADPERCRKQYS